MTALEVSSADAFITRKRFSRQASGPVSVRIASKATESGRAAVG